MKENTTILKGIYYYHNGLRHGTFKTFYKSGKVKSEGTYTEGILTGHYKLYNKEGKLYYHVIFSDEGYIMATIDTGYGRND